MGRVPNLINVHMIIGMNKQVPHTRNLSPGYLRIGRAE
jgi:hypothetical protein